MNKWLITGFGLTIVGSWLLVDGIRNRFELLDNHQPDSTEVSFTETVELASNLVPTANSAVLPDSIEKLDNNSKTVMKEDETSQDTKSLNKLNKPQNNPKVKNKLTVSDFGAQLSGNNYHQLLIESLIKDGWESGQLKMLSKYLSDPRAEFLPEVLKINATHVEKWEHYSHHLTEEGFEMCDNYWSKYRKEINASAKTYNFPPEIIVGILKVETNFGKYVGTRSVFNVFWSLSLGDNSQVKKDNLSELKKMNNDEIEKLHRRARWARLQLADLLYMAKSGGENPVGIMGSWAGAFGLCQFIPASYRAYGKDGDQDNVIDLDNIADASASIANYLKQNGWRGEMPRAKQKKSIMRYLAAQTFEVAGVNDLIVQVHGDAAENLSQYKDIGFCFLDTDKEFYQACYDIVIPRMRAGGILIADNAISHQEELQPLIDQAYLDDRVDAVVVPIGKGEFVCRKI